jgi:hypothetical protein
MYDLHVYHAGESVPSKMVSAKTAAEVFDLIPKLLAEYDGCERIAVLSGRMYLFTVDCHGERLPRDRP